MLFSAADGTSLGGLARVSQVSTFTEMDVVLPPLSPLGLGGVTDPLTVPPISSKKDDDWATKSLIEAIDVFVGGSKANVDWPPFWV